MFITDVNLSTAECCLKWNVKILKSIWLVLNIILDTLYRSVPEIYNSSKANSASVVMRNEQTGEPTLLEPLEMIFSVREL
jgi:hypothetical protein